MRRLPAAFYNLAPAGDPNRGLPFVTRELSAIANNLNHDPARRRPKVIGVCEAINRKLPELEGYRLIRSTQSMSRANVALYVRDTLELGETDWVRHEKTWPRMNDHSLTHESRTTLAQEVEDWRVIVGHAPVGFGAEAAREEWLDILTGLLHVPGPVVALTDPNRLGDDLHHRVPSAVTGGTPIEAVLGRGVVLDMVMTPGIVNQVPMLSDHRRCLLAQVRLPG